VTWLNIGKHGFAEISPFLGLIIGRNLVAWRDLGRLISCRKFMEFPV
jgi:hypothetical protein